MMKPRIALLLGCFLSLVTVPAQAATTQHVVLAGGCFWGMQAVFESLRGVTSARAGYAGGNAAMAHYEIVSTGMTGHAESVDVTYDPSQISFNQLLDVYFLVAHDPTELNRQGPDDGPQYRSEIFYTTPTQASQAAAYIAQLQRRHAYNAPVVTKLELLRGFYPAESYHQDFAVHNPDNPYIVVNDLPKLRKLKELYPQLVKPNAPLL
jgi:peptide-methionine (S)-S-oxide reductase